MKSQELKLKGRKQKRKMDNKEEVDNFNEVTKAGIIGVSGNILLFILKTITGFAFKSQAMIADAMNSAGDIFSSIMTIIGSKISKKPSDDSHDLGHGKAEYLFSLFIAVSMVLVAGNLIYNNVMDLVGNKSEIIYSNFLVLSAIITLITKFALYTYTKFKHKKIKSILLKANMKDHRNDCIVITCTLTSIILSKFGYTTFDNIVGIGIALWIAYTGLQIFKESINILMDSCVDEETKNTIIKIIKKYPEVQIINHLNSTPLGAKYMISVSIFVDGNISTFKSHEIADSIEKEISSLNNIQLTVVHVNPI